MDVSPFLAGSSLHFSISGDGVSIDPSTGVIHLDTASLLSGASMMVTAANSSGSADLSFRLAANFLEAPGALGAPGPLTLAQTAGLRTVSAQAFFTGQDLVYTLDAASPAGVTINPGSGLVTIPTGAAMQGTAAVSARNAAGSATQRFAVTVQPMTEPYAVPPTAPQDGNWTLDQIMVQK